MKRIEVVAAVIRNAQGDYFATQRGYGEFKDMWEFPGGKMEEGETPQQALKREIREELDTEISVGSFIGTVEWDYPQFHLTMNCYRCTVIRGKLELKEHEAARWLRSSELDSVDWLPADKEILKAISPRSNTGSCSSGDCNTEDCNAGNSSRTLSFDELVASRYSCKKFDGRRVCAQQLDSILEAGRLAPTAKNLQEQHIYVVESEEGLACIDRNTPCRYGAATCLVVTFDKTRVYTYPGGGRDSGIEDATIVSTHMLLAARAAGVDSCWVNNFNPSKLKSDLNLPDNEEILMIMDLGYAADGCGPLPNHFSRRPLEETVSHI